MLIRDKFSITVLDPDTVVRILDHESEKFPTLHNTVEVKLNLL